LQTPATGILVASWNAPSIVLIVCFVKARVPLRVVRSYKQGNQPLKLKPHQIVSAGKPAFGYTSASLQRTADSGCLNRVGAIWMQ
jgi:hypothetical protein